MVDAVVIGSGPNGLVAANVLADEGWTVTVLESQPHPGGAVRTLELIEPGFLNDMCSAFYPFGAASPVFSDLELERYGLTWCHAPLVLAHPSRDGTCPVISRDLDETAASLDAAGKPGDGDAWRRLFARWQQVRRGLLGLMFSPMPPVTGALKLLAALGPRDLSRFLRFMILPVRRLGEEEFGADAGRRLLTGTALHADLAPETPMSGFYGWIMSVLGQEVGFPVPEGGAGEITGALINRLSERGGDVHCSQRVVRVIVRDGRACGVEIAGNGEITARRAILADVSAPALYRELLPEDVIPSRVKEDLDRFQWDNGTVKVDWNLDGPIPWDAEPARRAGTVHLCDSLDAFTMLSAELVQGFIPARPFLVVGQQSVTDPTRQPAGKETAWAYTHVPRIVRGDHGGTLTGSWDAGEAARFADRVEEEVDAMAPGFRRLIRGRHILTPHSFEAHDANLDGGAVAGGSTQLHQQMIFRPTPGLGRPSTPVGGLFLASASVHPGGGVHGACGANAARAAIAQDRVRRAAYAIGKITGTGSPVS